MAKYLKRGLHDLENEQSKGLRTQRNLWTGMLIPILIPIPILKPWQFITALVA